MSRIAQTFDLGRIFIATFLGTSTAKLVNFSLQFFLGTASGGQFIL